MFDLLDPVVWHAQGFVPERAAAAARDLDGVAPIAFVIDGAGWTYRVADGTVVAAEGVADDAATVVELSRMAWSDLAQLGRTVPALQIADELTYARGGFGHLTRWEPALRLLYVGIPIYDPATADVPADLTQSFSLDDDDATLADFLLRAGFLHVRSVFGADEIAALNADVDRLAAQARPRDDRSWWAFDAAGEEVLCRLVYANLGSERIAALEHDPRLLRLVALAGADVRATMDRMEGVGVLLKSAGELRGLANIPWHVDCGLGGHPILCPSVAIGVQLTAASAEAGRFEVVAGSHGQTCRYALDGDLTGLPYVGVDTEPGDVTVHFADVMHASPPPTGAGGRRVMYVTWANSAIFDHVPAGRALNDLVRDRQAEAGAISRAVARPPGS